jgi:eukaryotic-like serine/threonine-protein kinase
MPLEPQTRLGPYEILASLGEGGMSEVYRARDTRLQREVALKVLPDVAANDDDRLARFEREVRAVAALNHPNIVALFDVGSIRGIPFVVTELLRGETLGARLRAGPVAPLRATDMVAQAADGLAVAHARGIVHRDIKPENLFLTSEGRVKILDFGIVRIEDPLTSELALGTRRGRSSSGLFVLGTAAYMSPEQVRGRRVDGRSDLFSLGVVFFELLTGQNVFLRKSAIETMDAVLNVRPDRLPESERVPEELRGFVFRCLEKDPADRYQSARDLVLDLRAFQAESLREAAGRVTFRSEPPWKRRRVRVIALWLIGVGIFLAGMLAGRGCGAP